VSIHIKNLAPLYTAGIVTSATRCLATAVRHVWNNVNVIAIKVGPINRPRSRTQQTRQKTPKIVRDIGLAMPKPISHGLMKLSTVLTNMG
jgi:hypothetical protein